MSRKISDWWYKSGVEYAFAFVVGVKLKKSRGRTAETFQGKAWVIWPVHRCVLRAAYSVVVRLKGKACLAKSSASSASSTSSVYGIVGVEYTSHHISRRAHTICICTYANACTRSISNLTTTSWYIHNCVIINNKYITRKAVIWRKLQWFKVEEVNDEPTKQQQGAAKVHGDK